MNLESGKHYTIVELLGEGSYGKVYKATDANGKEYAIKQINIDSNGVPCILEATIMSTFIHSGINSADAIFITNDHLNIVQERAQGDLSKILKNNPPPLEQAKKWLHQISQALFCLHKLGIIHGDIKAGNILHFSDDDVRLADFTLSAKLWNAGDKFKYPACTYTHCPPESLMGREWDRSLDIWSLGCTFYEVVFGATLFPFQGRLEDKKELRKRYCRAIYNHLENVEYEEESYFAVELSQNYTNPEYADFRDLLGKMIKIQPEQRITIEEVLNHNFFDKLNKSKLSINNVCYTPLSGNVLIKLQTTIEKLLTSSSKALNTTIIENIKSFTISIYQRSYSLVDKKVSLGSPDPICLGALWIASKFILGVPLPLSVLPLEQILLAERRICTYLNFCFPIISQASFI